MKPLKGSRYCFNHSPERAAERAQARRAGGQHTRAAHAGDPEQIHKAPRDIPQVMTILDYSLAETLELDNSIQRGRLLVSIAAAYGDLIRTGELETQLKELLRVLELRKE
jgi:hypothetical protein